MMGGMMTDWDDLAIDGRGHLTDLAAAPTYPPPADVTWTAAELFALQSPLWAQLAAVSDSAGIERTLRIVSEIREDMGDRFVLVVTEWAWREWKTLPVESRGGCPRPARAVPIRYVWVQHEAPQN